MYPGQRTSRKAQNLESAAFGVAGSDDGLDDYGVPTSLANRKGRGSGTSSKRGGFFGRMRRGNASSSAVDVNGGDSDDEGGGFDVIPGLTPMSQLNDNYQGGPYGSASAAASFATQQNLSSVPQLSGNMPQQRGSTGEISMDQISTLRDRHRYPTIEDEPKAGRAMSLTSMSNYDSTPVIPMLGPVNNSQSGSSYNKSSHQDQYRQRMIESRRALMSSETGIPLGSGPASGGGTNGVGGGFDQTAPHAPRTMSMGSVHSQLSAGGRMGTGPPSQRTSTMNSQSMGPLQMYGQSPHGMQRPGLGVQMGNGMANGGMPVNGPPMGPPMGPYSTRSSIQQSPNFATKQPYGGAPLTPNSAGTASPQPGLMPQYGSSGPQGYHKPTGSKSGYQAPPMAPPVATPLLNSQSNYHPSPGGPDMPPQQFMRGGQPPQVGLQRPNMGGEFNFRSDSPSASSLSPTTTREYPQDAAKHAAQLEELHKQLDDIKNDVRILSIELCESVRREHDLEPRDKASKGDDNKDNKEDDEAEDHVTAAERAEALAKAYSELASERNKREVAENVARNLGNQERLDLEQKFTDIEYRHSEAVHLLSIRTQQYDSLKEKYSLLEKDFKAQQETNNELLVRAKESKFSRDKYEQDEQLRKKLSTLENENEKLRTKLNEQSSAGSLSARITSLEDQRSALQEALRAMRERKDAEIQALSNRIEALSISQQRQRNVSSNSATSNLNNPSVTSLLNTKDAGPTQTLYRPKGGTLGSPTTPEGEEKILSLPRLRNSSLTRPASPLHLGLDYSR